MSHPRYTLAAALAILIAPALTRAEPALDQAAALYDQGRFEEALRVLARARQSADRPRLRARIDLQIGINHAVLGQEERARAAFVEALRGNPQVELDERVYKASVVTLFRETKARLRGSVEIGGRSGLLVLIDGQSAGRTPLRSELAIGRHRIEVRALDGSTLFRQEVLLPPDGRERVWVPEAPGVTLPRETPGTPGAPPRSRRVWTWVAAGAAVAAAGVSVGLYVWAGSGYDEYRTTPDPLRYDELAGTVPGRYRAAQATVGVAAASAAAAVVLFIVEGRPRSERRSLSASPGGLRFSF